MAQRRGHSPSEGVSVSTPTVDNVLTAGLELPKLEDWPPKTPALPANMNTPASVGTLVRRFKLDELAKDPNATAFSVDEIAAWRSHNPPACTVEMLGTEARKRWKAAGVDRPGKMWDSTAPSQTTSSEHTAIPADPAPAPAPVDGAELLSDLSAWIRRYVWVSPESADALAVWAVLTWFVDVVYFAPILALLSATKRCGKSLVLDLLRTVVRRARPTSGIGATSAVVFRLNDAHHPTFLIDEAEKLSGRDGDRDLIGLLNNGYRSGAQVQRCVGDKHEVKDFDAFGFRALAAIGNLWDTILDRSVIVRLERRPKGATVERFNGRVVEREGAELVARLARWSADVADVVGEEEETSPRPAWLNDRACDNWSGMFAIAAVAGGDWPARVEAAARKLSGAEEMSEDPAERLVHDIRTVFNAAANPDFISSSDLAQRLNELDSAPWSDYSRGQGISKHRVALKLKPFGIHPRQDASGKVRGYRLADLHKVFQRYPSPAGPPSEVSDRQRSNNSAASPGFSECQTDQSSDTCKSAGKQTTIRVSDTLTLPTPPEPEEGGVEPDGYDRQERLAIQSESELEVPDLWVSLPEEVV